MKSPLLHLTLSILICAVALAGYGYWYSTISNKSVAVATLEQEIKAKTETISRIAVARATLAEIAEDEAAVQAYFVPEAKVVSFITDLQARASAVSASLKVLSVSTSGGKKPTLTLSLAVDGTFDAVMRTIGAVEYAPYHLSIARVTLGENGKGAWHAELSIVVGSVRAQTASSTPSSAVKTLSLLTTPYDHR